MARISRIFISGFPYRATQPGNHRQPIFFEPGDQADGRCQASNRTPSFVPASPSAWIFCMPSSAAAAGLVIEVHRTFLSRAFLQSAVITSGQLVDTEGGKSSDGVFGQDSLLHRQGRCQTLHAPNAACGRIYDFEVRSIGLDAQNDCIEQSAQGSAPTHQPGESAAR